MHNYANDTIFFVHDIGLYFSVFIPIIFFL